MLKGLHQHRVPHRVPSCRAGPRCRWGWILPLWPQPLVSSTARCPALLSWERCREGTLSCGVLLWCCRNAPPHHHHLSAPRQSQGGSGSPCLTPTRCLHQPQRAALCARVSLSYRPPALCVAVASHPKVGSDSPLQTKPPAPRNRAPLAPYLVGSDEAHEHGEEGRGRTVLGVLPKVLHG